MPGKYAESTSVDAAKSRAEIERTLTRWGATSFAYGWDADHAMVGFILKDRQIRLSLVMPPRDSREFTHTPTRRQRRTPEQAEAAYEQAVRQRWRALALVIKAKLEAVEAGIVTLDDEFAMHYVLPSGHTVGDWMTPQLEKIYADGTMPALLPGAHQGSEERA